MDARARGAFSRLVAESRRLVDKTRDRAEAIRTQEIRKAQQADLMPDFGDSDSRVRLRWFSVLVGLRIRRSDLAAVLLRKAVEAGSRQTAPGGASS